jgi:hypothetical protein
LNPGIFWANFIHEIWKFRIPKVHSLEKFFRTLLLSPKNFEIGYWSGKIGKKLMKIAIFLVLSNKFHRSTTLTTLLISNLGSIAFGVNWILKTMKFGILRVPPKQSLSFDGLFHCLQCTEKQKQLSEQTRTFRTNILKVFTTSVGNLYSQTIKTFVSNGINR